ncbi:MAG: hypothetical protein KC591_02860, partial [Gemmatimonadetes bacterium]|nr:hypothetical protein [Gemmatimonadota bacterium]
MSTTTHACEVGRLCYLARLMVPASSRLSLALFTLSLAWAGPAPAAEIDSWTGRYDARPDVARPLDRLLGARLRAGVEAANGTDGACDTERLYRSVKHELGSLPVLVGHAIAEWLDGEPVLDSRIVPFEASVYRDLTLLDGPSVRLRGLSGTIVVDDHVIGVDKLGHFFAEGWGYFERAHLEGKGV